MQTNKVFPYSIQKRSQVSDLVLGQTIQKQCFPGESYFKNLIVHFPSLVRKENMSLPAIHLARFHFYQPMFFH